MRSVGPLCPPPNETDCKVASLHNTCIYSVASHSWCQITPLTQSYTMSSGILGSQIQIWPLCWPPQTAAARNVPAPSVAAITATKWYGDLSRPYKNLWVDSHGPTQGAGHPRTQICKTYLIPMHNKKSFKSILLQSMRFEIPAESPIPTQGPLNTDDV